MIRISVFLVLMLGIAPAPAVAEPIPNMSFANQSVGWFDAKGLTCPQICSEQQARAEREDNTAGPSRASYVCKLRKSGQGPYVWLFGTQFASRPACYVTNVDLKGEYSDIFYCLCVRGQE